MSAFLTTFFSWTANLDNIAIHAMQSIGPFWKPVALFLSNGVGYYPIMVIVLAAALFMIEKRRVAIELIIITCISFAALFVLKHYFDSPRPYIVDPTVIAYDQEFNNFGLPSGHALMSMVILGWVILKHPKSKILSGGSIFLVILIGLSRVYLGLHYPSQVVAGWLFGLLFLYIFYIIDKRLWSPFKKEIRKR